MAKSVKSRKVPVKKGFLTLDKTHKMFFQTFGNPNGAVYLFCHGGPGYHSTLGVLDNFNLKRDYVILYDQRGCGRSKPNGELKGNQTHKLVEDITKLLNHLNIRKKVNLYGGSWGTTLALCYAIKNPNRVSNLILRGVFLGRKEDVDAIYYPKKSWTLNQKYKYEMTLGHLVKKFKIKDVIKESYKILIKGNKDSDYFCKYWAMYEDMICSNDFNLHIPDKEYLKVAKTISLIETHYFKNNCFIPKNYILKNVSKLKNIKTYIVHGKQDMVCPVYQAQTLHKALKNSELQIDHKGGHSSSTGNMAHKIKNIISKISRHVSK